MIIRPATTEDYNSVMGLYCQFVGDDRFAQSGSDSFLQVLDDPSYNVWLAEKSNKIIGFVTFYTRRVVRYPLPILKVEELFVSSAYRRLGIASKFFRNIEAWAKENKCCRIYVESAYRHEDAHKFYENNGYDNCGYYFMKRFS